MNRLTWRSLLCMETVGPGVNMSHTIPAPLDREQLDNVQATAADMSAEWLRSLWLAMR